MSLYDVETADCAGTRRASEGYRLKAVECHDRAAAASDPATRVNYLELADYWNDMAREAERRDQIRPQP